MRKSCIALAAVAVLVFATPARAGEWSLDEWMNGKSAWEGHAVGSSYTEETTSKTPTIPNMPDIPGMPKGGTTVTTVKHTLQQITETEFVIKVETTIAGRTTTTEDRQPRKRHAKATITELGEGVVEVGGTKYACKKRKVSDWGELIAGSMPKPKPGQGAPELPRGPATVWEHPEQGVLKVVADLSMMGQPMTTTMLWTNLSVTRTVGGHEFTCREVTMSNSMMPGTMVMITSRKFPGGTVERVQEMEMMGHKSSTTTKVTAYVKKPLVVTGAPR
jgi:hypothetical protein